MQRPPIISERTDVFVAPGSYDPRYEHIFPDLARYEQFREKANFYFASRSERFRRRAGERCQG